MEKRSSATNVREYACKQILVSFSQFCRLVSSFMMNKIWLDWSSSIQHSCNPFDCIFSSISQTWYFPLKRPILTSFNKNVISCDLYRSEFSKDHRRCNRYPSLMDIYSNSSVVTSKEAGFLFTHKRKLSSIPFVQSYCKYAEKGQALEL